MLSSHLQTHLVTGLTGPWTRNQSHPGVSMVQLTLGRAEKKSEVNKKITGFLNQIRASSAVMEGGQNRLHDLFH